MTTLLDLKQIAQILNFSEEEVMELIRQKRIPNIYFPKEDRYVFPKEEVLNAITPRPKAKEESPFGPDELKPNETNEPVVVRRGRPKKQI
jgi:hypothetical protein